MMHVIASRAFRGEAIPAFIDKFRQQLLRLLRQPNSFLAMTVEIRSYWAAHRSERDQPCEDCLPLQG
jgi:hypothetical protein